ncbi:UNVERIFIED_CONTAM: hypothetical protein FKN15_011222 [Acipenser sinensis]
MSSARLWWPERSALCLLSGSHYGVRPRELFADSAVTLQHYRREQERSATNARLVSAGASAPLENTDRSNANEQSTWFPVWPGLMQSCAVRELSGDGNRSRAPAVRVRVCSRETCLCPE